VINLAVGGNFFNSYGTLSAQDASNWPDSTYQIDYIRAYQWVNTSSTVSNGNGPNTSVPKSSSSEMSTRASSAASSQSIKTSKVAESSSEMSISESTSVDNDVNETSIIEDQNAQPIGNIDDGNTEQSAVAKQDIMTDPKYVIGGVAGGCGLFIIIAVVISVALYKKRTRQKDLIDQVELQDPSSVATETLPKSDVTNVTISTIFVPVVGLQCLAKYSDGNFYPVTIEAVHDAQCYVNYGADYGGEKEWVHSSRMKANT